MKIMIHDYAGHAFPSSLSRALAARGHEVVHAHAGALQSPRGGLWRRDGDAPGLSFREIPMDPAYPRHKDSFIRRRAMEVCYGHAAAAFIEFWRPDVVLSGNTPTETQESIIRATLAGGGRFYHWLQDFHSHAVDKLLRRKIPLAGRWVGAWYRRLERRQFQRSSRVVASTGDFTPLLEQEFGIDPSRVAVVPNWAPIEEIPVRPKDNTWSRLHGLQDRFVFLRSGILGTRHNPAMLLDLAQTHAHDDTVRIVVVSEGAGADWLRRVATGSNLENLIILPYQPFSDLPDVLATADVLVGLQEEDAGTLAVPAETLSYFCARRPLLLAMPGENPAARVAEDEEAGVVVSPENLTGFLNASIRLRNDKETRDTLAANARAYAERTFPIEKTASAFEEILSR